MAQAQGGDGQAYEQLLTELYPVVRKFLTSKMGPSGAQDDIVQECIMAIHKARHTYDPQRSFMPWMFAVVRYKSIDILRKLQKQWAREIQDDERVATIAADDSNNKEEASLVREAINNLPEDMRRAVTLTKLDGLDTKEAAEQEGISPVALRTRVSRAYKLLRENLEKELVE